MVPPSPYSAHPPHSLQVEVILPCLYFQCAVPVRFSPRSMVNPGIYWEFKKKKKAKHISKQTLKLYSLSAKLCPLVTNLLEYTMEQDLLLILYMGQGGGKKIGDFKGDPRIPQKFIFHSHSITASLQDDWVCSICFLWAAANRWLILSGEKYH